MFYEWDRYWIEWAIGFLQLQHGDPRRLKCGAIEINMRHISYVLEQNVLNYEGSIPEELGALGNLWAAKLASNKLSGESR